MSTQTDKKKIKIDNGTTFGKVYTDVASDAKYASATNFDALETKVIDLANDVIKKQDALTPGEHITISNNVISADDHPTNIALKNSGFALFDSDGNIFDSPTLFLDDDTITSYTKNGKTYITVPTTEVDAYTKTESDAKYATQTSLSNAVSSLEDKISLKQDALTAGDGISIDNNVISATSSGGCEVIIRSW